MASSLASLQSKVRLSKGEIKLLQLLSPHGKRIDTFELAQKYYAKQDAPFNSRLVIVGMVRTLQKKIKTVDDPPFYVCTTERAGPYPMQVWRSRHAD